jgi:hypothetical protein
MKVGDLVRVLDKHYSNNPFPSRPHTGKLGVIIQLPEQDLFKQCLVRLTSGEEFWLDAREFEIINESK